MVLPPLTRTVVRTSYQSSESASIVGRGVFTSESMFPLCPVSCPVRKENAGSGAARDPAPDRVAVVRSAEVEGLQSHAPYRTGFNGIFKQIA